MPINQERIRFRYGMCLNDKCEKCKSKEVQEVPARKEFVCSECGKPLRECPPPKRGGSKWLYGMAGIVGLLLVGGLAWWLMGGNQEPQPRGADAAQVADSLRRDSLEKANRAAAANADSLTTDSLTASAGKAQRERDSLQAVADSLQRVANERKAAPAPVAPAPAAAPAPRPAAPAATSGSKNLGYATFKGTWPNDVNGRLVFKTSHVIDSRDPKGRMAEPGDYVIGEFSDGHLVQGIWYGADNQVKGSIIIGK